MADYKTGFDKASRYLYNIFMTPARLDADYRSPDFGGPDVGVLQDNKTGNFSIQFHAPSRLKLNGSERGGTALVKTMQDVLEKASPELNDKFSFHDSADLPFEQRQRRQRPTAYLSATLSPQEMETFLRDIATHQQKGLVATDLTGQKRKDGSKLELTPDELAADLKSDVASVRLEQTVKADYHSRQMMLRFATAEEAIAAQEKLPKWMKPHAEIAPIEHAAFPKGYQITLPIVADPSMPILDKSGSRLTAGQNGTIDLHAATQHIAKEYQQAITQAYGPQRGNVMDQKDLKDLNDKSMSAAVKALCKHGVADSYGECTNTVPDARAIAQPQKGR